MTALLAFGLPSGGEWIYLFIIVLILFGPKKLPELARGIGQGLREFKKASREVVEELEKSDSPRPSDPPGPAALPGDPQPPPKA